MRRRNAPRTDARQRILDAALELFAERGYHATSMRDLARAVGVRESALYHHFEAKERILEAVIRERSQQSYQIADEQLGRLADRPLEEVLGELAERSLAELQNPTGRRVIKIVLGLGRKGLHSFPTMVEAQRQNLAKWNQIVTVLKASGRLRPDVDPTVFWTVCAAPLYFISGVLFEDRALPPAALKRFMRAHVAAMVRAFGHEGPKMTKPRGGSLRSKRRGGAP